MGLSCQCQLFAVPASDKSRAMHLRGDAARLFPTIGDQLNAVTFDTALPVDAGRLPKELGPQVRIQGGAPTEFLRTATPSRMRAEVKHILQAVLRERGLFVLRNRHNTAPHTPSETLAVICEAGQDVGKLG